MDQFLGSTFQIRDVLVQTHEGSVETPKAEDILGIGIGALEDTLININPNLSVFLIPMVLVKAPDLSAVLKDVPGETQLQVAKVPQDKADEENSKI